MISFTISLISSNEDIASQNIRNQLLEHYPFIEQQEMGAWNPEHFKKRYIYTLVEHVKNSKNKSYDVSLIFDMVITDHPMITLDSILKPDELLGDLIIFLSRHKSESGEPALLCHTPGNWSDDNRYGGGKRRIAMGSGILLHYLYNLLVKNAREMGLEIKIGQEVTHHGPSEFNRPIAFIELGSDPIGWENITGAKVVAKTVIETGKSIVLNNFDPEKKTLIKGDIKICAGFGGTHYMPNLIKLVRLGCGFAHVVPKYHIENLDGDLLEQIARRTLEPIDYFVIDWKGTNAEQKKILQTIFQAKNLTLTKRKDLEKKLKNGN